MRRLADVTELYPVNGSTVEVPIRQDDLASMAGTARPTANRVLKQLEVASIVEPHARTDRGARPRGAAAPGALNPTSTR